MWVFGYGSLIWKVDFPYERRVIGYIKGYVRRFWQASIDHRGVPGKPGRVVTLIPSNDPEDKVWGVAYELPEDQVDQIKGRLDEREKRYQTNLNVPFYPKQISSNKSSVLVHVYVAPTFGPLFLGETDAVAMAEQIKSARGPSGDNLDYLAKLFEFMRDEVGSDAEEDTHLTMLFRLCFP
ncbi:putative glutathione-specific gamma-glutamylcyclotransferase 2 isoform X3 [Daphnia magna]|uniref:putative glutathione-specific gamma-glutamylcyclotransferase 2 isoform X3 n=1 Tax=Daphnia magna TaxID=35525 RepID=UPI001403E073|nr:putative glutathione-specific gamma-glutamylcyclotransferase 2 isoform X3 [Daphnia magna]